MTTFTGTDTGETIRPNGVSATVIISGSPAVPSAVVDVINAGGGNDIVEGGGGADSIDLGAGADIFVWKNGDGSDVVDGGSGVDTALLDGSTGADRYALTVQGSNALLSRAFGTETLTLARIEHITLDTGSGADIVNIDDPAGSGIESIFVGLDGPNGGGDGAVDSVAIFAGGGGKRITVASSLGDIAIRGLSARIDIDGTDPGDSLLIIAGTGNESVDASGLFAGHAALTVQGGSGDDTIIGSDGDDFLQGNGDNDTVTGGKGDDRVDLGSGDDVFVASALDGDDEVDGGNGFDRLRYTAGNGDETITLRAGGKDALFDRSGIDEIALVDVERIELAAGAGRDLIHVRELSATDINEVAIDLAAAGGAKSDGAVDEVTFDGGSAAETIVIARNGGQLSILGGAVAVTIRNFDGKDIVTIAGFAGADTLDASALASGDIVVRLAGGAADDTLIAGGASDALFGDGGFDTADYSRSRAAVTVDLGTGKGAGGDATGDAYGSIERAVGSRFGDTLIGSDATNALVGNGGNDLLRGGKGGDRIEGGAGIDTADYAGSAAGVTIDLATGAASGGDAAGDILSGIENLNGSAFADSLSGNAGANRLDGKGGADRMAGGAGNDTYIVDNAGDIVIEAAGGGTDAVVSSVAFTLGAEVENLTLVGPAGGTARTVAVNGVGNALANAITGSAGANLIDGGAGNDLLRGAGGNDRIIGRAGDDTLSGGRGKDRLDGGEGRDAFLFDAALGNSNIDRVVQFKAKDDTILLDADVFAGVAPGVLKRKAFVEGKAARDGNDRIILTDKGKLLFDPDGKGGAKAVAFAKLGKGIDLSHADFLVV